MSRLYTAGVVGFVVILVGLSMLGVGGNAGDYVWSQEANGYVISNDTNWMLVTLGIALTIGGLSLFTRGHKRRN